MDFLTQLEVNPVLADWQRELSVFPELEEDGLMSVEEVEVKFESLDWMGLSPTLPLPLPADINNSPICLLSPTSEQTPPALVTDCQETSQLAEGMSMDFTGIGDSLLCIAGPNPKYISPVSATDCRGASEASQSAKETSPTSESSKDESLDATSTADSSTSVASSNSEDFPFILATDCQGASGSQRTKWISFNLITRKSKQVMNNAPQRLHENATASNKSDVESSEPTSGEFQSSFVGQLRTLRYKLQRAILKENKWLKDKDTEAAADALTQLENMENPSRAAILESRIDLLLRKIEKVRDIPGNDEDQVIQRGLALFKKWKIGSKEGPRIGSQDQPEILSPPKLDSDKVSNLDSNNSSKGASTETSLEEDPNMIFVEKKRKRLPVLENRRLRQKHDVNYRNELKWLNKTKERCEQLLKENTADMKSLEEQMKKLERRGAELLKEKADLLQWGAEDEKVTAALERRSD